MNELRDSDVFFIKTNDVVSFAIIAIKLFTILLLEDSLSAHDFTGRTEAYALAVIRCEALRKNANSVLIDFAISYEEENKITE